MVPAYLDNHFLNFIKDLENKKILDDTFVILMSEAEMLRKKRSKITVNDFEPVAIIGRGAFGEVRVCRKKDTQEIVAIKKMKK